MCILKASESTGIQHRLGEHEGAAGDTTLLGALDSELHAVGFAGFYWGACSVGVFVEAFSFFKAKMTDHCVLVEDMLHCLQVLFWPMNSKHRVLIISSVLD